MVFKLPKPKRRVNEKMTLESLHKSAETYREMYDEIRDKYDILQKQLDIAVKALTTYSQSNSTIVVFRDLDGWNVQTEIYDKCSEIAEKALKKIEELNK